MARSNKYQSVNLTRFFMKFVGFWHGETPREQFFLNIVLIYAVIAIIFAILVETADLYHCIGDFYRITDNLCTTLLLVLILVKMGSFILQRELVLKVITFAEKNFWSVEYDEESMRIIKDYNSRGVIMTYTFTAIVQVGAFEYILLPVLVKKNGFAPLSRYLSGPIVPHNHILRIINTRLMRLTEKGRQYHKFHIFHIDGMGKNSTERRLPFNLYVDLPFTVTPYYEITYLIQSLSTFHSGVCTCCFDNFVWTFNIHIAAQFKILAHRISLIADKYLEYLKSDEKMTQKQALRLAYDDLKSCVRQHWTLIAYVEDLEKVFTAIVLGQTLLSSVAICFGGFQVLAATSSLKKCIFVLHFIGAVGQLLIYTWTCHDIIVQSMRIADMAYAARWYLFPQDPAAKALKFGLYLMSVRARKPCVLTAGGFAVLSLETFTGILSTSMSYFALLRQMSEN